MPTDDDRFRDHATDAIIKLRSDRFSGDKRIAELLEAQVYATLAVAHAISALADVRAEIG